MRVDGVPYRTLWRDGPAVAVIDQRALDRKSVV